MPAIVRLSNSGLTRLVAGGAGVRETGIRVYNRPMEEEILVSAASSLTDAFREIGKRFARENGGVPVRFNFGSSGALARQILAGAPADVFASASLQEMDDLEKAERISPKTKQVFATNTLALITPPKSSLADFAGLKAGSIRRVALSNPDTVPSGRYAREALTRFGLWDIVRAKAVFGENVRQTMTYVINGDADAGIVFATDSRSARSKVREVKRTHPGLDHKVPVYPAAVVTGSAKPEVAHRFVEFLLYQEPQRILYELGFGLPR